MSTKPTRGIARAMADGYTNPVITSSRVIHNVSGQQVDLKSLTETLRSTTEAIQAGDTSRIESMLAAQIHALDSIFGAMSVLAVEKMYAGKIEASEKILRLALRAQHQTARTAEVLGNLKNPRQIAYVAQANIANGPQQINNVPNELTGGTHELHPHPGTSCNASGPDQSIQTLVAVDRTKKSGG